VLRCHQLQLHPTVNNHQSIQSHFTINPTLRSIQPHPPARTRPSILLQIIKMPTSHISTPLAGVSPVVAIAALHNHDLMIKTLCPALVAYNFESGDKTSCATYSITDRKPIGQVCSTPFSKFLPDLITDTVSQTTYKLTLTNVSEGVDSLVNAKPPVGVLTIQGKWRVKNGELSEEVDIDANFMMKKVAKSNVEKTHPGQHVKLLEAARG
jgi:hypothetical protein